MMTKIRDPADTAYFSVNKAVGYMIAKWDFQVIGKHRRTRVLMSKGIKYG